MLNYGAISCALSIFLLTGCATPSTVDRSARIHDIRISGHALITPVELYATVGDEIRWHNLLEAPIHLGFLGVNPVKKVSCEKGLKTWFGDIKDFVTIRAGNYVSACFQRAGTIRYNVWQDLSDPFHSMSPVGVIHLDETG